MQCDLSMLHCMLADFHDALGNKIVLQPQSRGYAAQTFFCPLPEMHA